MYIEGNIYDIFSGEFGLGIYTQKGQNDEGNEFSEIVIALLFFDIIIGEIK
jgi:hypothetical protein